MPKKLYFCHLSRYFSKWRLFLKFWFFDHSSESLALTSKELSATDFSHRDGHFGIFVGLYLEYFGFYTRKTLILTIPVIARFRKPVFNHEKCISSYNFHPIHLKFSQNNANIIIEKITYAFLDIIYSFWNTYFQSEKFPQNCHFHFWSFFKN